VELAVVVTIVGVLAVLAVVGYRKLTLSAKVTEAKTMVSAIRIAQEDYKVERGVYANLGATKWCPSSGDIVGGVTVKWAWDPGCSGGVAKWETLPVHVDGPVQFGYQTVAGPPGAVPASFVDMTAGNVTRPWYVIKAQADLNGDGATGLQTEVVGSSFDNNIHSRQDGE
jgi:type IV pilus assembly protein PilA